jgi:UDP-N-acetylglucosamine acyltransferase
MGSNTNNQIHPTAIIGKNVKLGQNNIIGPYCIIYNNTIIGNNNLFQSSVIVGSPAEHRDYLHNTNNKFGVIIGNNNVFREFVTINSGTNRETQIGNNVTMLRCSHLGHDVIVEDKVTLSCNVLIGGESYIMEGVNCGLGAVIHQYSVLGAYSMIGMNSTVTKTSKIDPGNIYIGNPAVFLKINKIGLERNNINNEELSIMMNDYLILKNK